MDSTRSQAGLGLKTYAEQRIELLRLGPSGPLGINYVLAYDDTDPSTIHLSDGLTDTTCHSPDEIDHALQLWICRVRNPRPYHSPDPR